MAAAQYLPVAGYSALILRENFADLNQPGGLVPLSREWWSGRAHWSETMHRWTFPCGSTVSFGYLQRDDSVYQYQGSRYQFIGVDELTQHTEWRYRYLFSRLDRPADGPLSQVPLRMRATSNPGGKGHGWVRARFVSDRTRAPGCVFVPARVEDNPAVDQPAYIRSLGHLDPLTRAQLLKGDWDVHEGGRFRREWFREFIDLGDAWRLDPGGPGGGIHVRKCDATIVAMVDPANRPRRTSKYTAITVFADVGRQRLLVLDSVRERLELDAIVPRLNQVCQKWRPVWVGIEANGFQLGLVNEARSGRHRHIPTVVELDHGGKDKLTRATPAIIRAEQGLIHVSDDGRWVEDWLAEHAAFTGDDKVDSYTDQVDNTAYCVLRLDAYGGADVDDAPAAAGGWGRRS